MEITPQQASILDLLRTQNFELVAFPMYENYVGIRKGNCAALLMPVENGGFNLYGHPTYLINGNLSAKMFNGDGHYFVSKKDKLEANPERSAELEKFSAELAELLLPVA